MLPSERTVVYDTVTLHIFSTMDRMDLLLDLYGHKPQPRWAEVVHGEVVKGRNHPESNVSSARILNTPWMGAPAVPKDTGMVLRIQAALATDDSKKDANLGEAESMVLAIETGGIFVTDDKAAYDLAIHRADLGPDRVMDSCALLRAAQAENLIDAAGVREFHLAIAPHRSMRCRCQY